MSRREALIQKFLTAREKLRALVDQADPRKQIYPGWTIREVLAHITGWDDSVIATLQAHLHGVTPAIKPWLGVDAYNAETLSTREAMDLAHVRAEWEQTRAQLIHLLRSIPDEEFARPLLPPWGRECTVEQYLHVFIEHESEEHARDLEEWLRHPDGPLTGTQ